MLLSILFVPFDAALQHYTRNASKGVKGYVVDQEPDKGLKRRRDEDEDLEPVGTPLELRPVKKLKADPTASQASLTSQLAAILSHTCRQILDETAVEQCHPHQGTLANVSATQKVFSEHVARRQATAYPHVIFLSEEPGELEFPSVITLTTAEGLSVVYKRQGQAGSKAVQRIFGYVRQDLGGTWTFTDKKKTATLGSADEHVLIGSVDMFGKVSSFAGVHLSSKNVGASEGDRQRILKDLVTFCQGQKIQFVLGDFNIDTHTDDNLGNVGATPGSTIFVNDGKSVSFGMQYKEQYSNSTNEKHFMGHLIIDPEVSRRGLMGLSLQRSMGGSYFSDHPPIWVELDFP